MKKILFLLLISSVAAFGKTKGNHSKPIPKAQLSKIKSMICFGWENIYSSTTGEVIGKRSDNCWNARQGSHSTTVLYE
jgi:hypothetical protein